MARYGIPQRLGPTRSPEPRSAPRLAGAARQWPVLQDGRPVVGRLTNCSNLTPVPMAAALFPCASPWPQPETDSTPATHLRTPRHAEAPEPLASSGTRDTVARRITSYALASGADWYDHAALFQDGDPIGGNPHHRKVRLKDGAFAIIRAYTPQLTRSNLSRAAFAFGAMAALATICAGAAMGLPAVLALSAGGLAILASSASAFLIPDDAGWQGYTSAYYATADDQQPLTVGYYGWLPSPSIYTSVTLDGLRNPKLFRDFADDPSKMSWHRWNWNSKEASPREPSFPFAQALTAADPAPQPLALQAPLPDPARTPRPRLALPHIREEARHGT